MNQTQQAQEKIKDILGLEVSPDGEENFFLIKDEDGNVLEGMDFSDEVDALTDLLAQTIKDTEERIVREIEETPIEKAHTYGSENAEIYRAYEEGQERFKKIIINLINK